MGHHPAGAHIALASGDRELAESAAAGAERRAGTNPRAPAFPASAVHARGLLTGAPGLLTQAVSILEAGQRRPALASALEDLAVAEIRAGRGEQAIVALDRALAIYAGCGARWTWPGSGGACGSSGTSAACPLSAGQPWGGRP